MSWGAGSETTNHTNCANRKRVRENEGTDQKPYLLTQMCIQNWVKNIGGKHIQRIDNKAISRIYGHGKGWVFTPAQFSDLGSRDAGGSKWV